MVAGWTFCPAKWKTNLILTGYKETTHYFIIFGMRIFLGANLFLTWMFFRQKFLWSDFFCYNVIHLEFQQAEKQARSSLQDRSTKQYQSHCIILQLWSVIPTFMYGGTRGPPTYMAVLELIWPTYNTINSKLSQGVSQRP